MNPIALLATKWYFIVTATVFGISCTRCLASLELRDELTTAQIGRDRAKCREIAKNFTEFFLTLTIWIVSLRYWATSFDDRFGTGFLLMSHEDVLFLVATSLVPVAPFYALVWAWGCTFKPCNKLTLDACSKHDDHHLYCLAKKLGLVWLFLGMSRAAWKIGCVAAAIVTGYCKYYRNKFHRAQS